MTSESYRHYIGDFLEFSYQSKKGNNFALDKTHNLKGLGNIERSPRFRTLSKLKIRISDAKTSTSVLTKYAQIESETIPKFSNH